MRASASLRRNSYRGSALPVTQQPSVASLRSLPSEKPEGPDDDAGRNDAGDRRMWVEEAAPEATFKRGSLLLVAFLLLVVRPGAPSSILAPSSTARSP